MPDLDIKNVLSSYQDGLKGKSVSVPDTIKSMTIDALKKGFPAKAKELQGNALVRKVGMEEVDPATKIFISDLIQNQFQTENLKVIDLVATSKISGGSGGLKRYEILITNNAKQLIHLELKQLAVPSIAPVAVNPIPDQLTRMKKTLQVDQGSGFSHYYNVFNIRSISMLLRPKFAGNIGITLSDSANHDNKQIISFEAYILGRIHAGSVDVTKYSKAIDTMGADQWEADVTALSEVFSKRYDQLKK
jgi:hypothetical protein